MSIVVPVLNEAGAIAALAESLEPLRERGHETLLVDGGSTDGTPELAAALFDRVLSSAPGRAVQMNAGAAAARGAVLVFLHADTRLPADAESQLLGALHGAAEAWGRFDVRLSGRHTAFRLIERMMNWRSRASGIATGDQAMFVTRGLFRRAGGFPALALMEDVALSRRLRRLRRPLCLPGPAITSSRRWEHCGIVRTVVLMWALRAGFALGVSPDRLARLYGR